MEDVLEAARLATEAQYRREGWDRDPERPDTHLLCAGCGRSYQKCQRLLRERHREKCKVRDQVARERHYRRYGPRDLATIRERGSFLIEVCRHHFGDGQSPIVLAIAEYFGDRFVSCDLTNEGGTLVVREDGRQESLTIFFSEALERQALRFAGCGDMRCALYSVSLRREKKVRRGKRYRTEIYFARVPGEGSDVRRLFWPNVTERDEGTRKLLESGYQAEEIRQGRIEIPKGLSRREALVYLARWVVAAEDEERGEAS